MKISDISSFGEGKIRVYVVGYILSIILTIIPFALVMNNISFHWSIILTITILAILQVIVHVVCFLRLKFTSDQTWNWLAFSYTLILLFALIGGSVWIMYHLMQNMMTTM